MIEKVSTYNNIGHNTQLFVEWSQICLNMSTLWEFEGKHCIHLQ